VVIVVFGVLAKMVERVVGEEGFGGPKKLMVDAKSRTDTLNKKGAKTTVSGNVRKQKGNT
jgi:hypothetical protein